MGNCANTGEVQDTDRTLVKQEFEERLDTDYQDRLVNVEFFCGECCKKVVGGILTRIGKDFIEVTAAIPFTPFLVLTFFGGSSIPVVETATAIIIPLKQVCSVERP